MTAGSTDMVAVPQSRRAGIRRLAEYLKPGMRVALSTHVSADGDGCGTEVALARLLPQLGLSAFIVNPTPWPATFQFLLGDDVTDRSAEGARALATADLLLVVDISDVSRLGGLSDAVRSMKIPCVVVDHHIPAAEPPGDVVLADTTACACGELVFDIARELGLEISGDIAAALYTAILTDTGGFRFSNTSPRCHAVAGALLAAGADPEAMYRQIYASVSLGRLQLLRDALASLHVDAEAGLSWMTVTAAQVDKSKVNSDDMDGIVEHARSVKGTRMALFFRELGHGKVKVSFRSVGGVDVNHFARRFGGGGHVRAAGALLPGRLDEVVSTVVAAAREFLAGDSAGVAAGAGEVER